MFVKHRLKKIAGKICRANRQIKMLEDMIKAKDVTDVTRWRLESRREDLQRLLGYFMIEEVRLKSRIKEDA